jgi:hypothetical protein
MSCITKKLFILKLVILALIINLRAQNLRDIEHTHKFADFLFMSGQFQLASEEYERLAYLDTLNIYSKLRLLQSYRLSGKPKLALQKFNHYFINTSLPTNAEIGEEYLKNLILDKQNDKLIEFSGSFKQFDENTRQNYTLAAILLKKDWDNAFKYALNNPVTGQKKNADLHVLAFQSKQLKYKKPFVAAMFSAIIPGTGKMYTKNWKDGLMSLMFVGLNTWQAYRGFHKNGGESVYGWVFTGVAGGFYIGNIYGAHKSAKKYNNKLDEDIYHTTWHLVVDDF